MSLCDAALIAWPLSGWAITAWIFRDVYRRERWWSAGDVAFTWFLTLVTGPIAGPLFIIPAVLFWWHERRSKPCE
jgi:hypothetical protein